MSNDSQNTSRTITIELTPDELSGALEMLWDVINNRYQQYSNLATGTVGRALLDEAQLLYDRLEAARG